MIRKANTLISGYKCLTELGDALNLFNVLKTSDISQIIESLFELSMKDVAKYSNLINILNLLEFDGENAQDVSYIS